MSHIVTIKNLLVNNKDAIKKAAEKVKATFKHNKHIVSINNKKIECEYSVHLKGWTYPVAIDNGKLLYDNYDGNWGSNDRLDEFLREYNTEVAIINHPGLIVESIVNYADGSREVVFTN